MREGLNPNINPNTPRSAESVFVVKEAEGEDCDNDDDQKIPKTSGCLEKYFGSGTKAS